MNTHIQKAKNDLWNFAQHAIDNNGTELTENGRTIQIEKNDVRDGWTISLHYGNNLIVQDIPGEEKSHIYEGLIAVFESALQ